jgi:hypothetical protein
MTPYVAGSFAPKHGEHGAGAGEALAVAGAAFVVELALPFHRQRVAHQDSWLLGFVALHPFGAFSQQAGVGLLDVPTQLDNALLLVIKALVVLPELEPALVTELDFLDHGIESSAPV